MLLFIFEMIIVNYCLFYNRGYIIKTASMPYNMLNYQLVHLKKILLLLLFMLLLPHLPALGHAFCVTFREVA